MLVLLVGMAVARGGGLLSGAAGGLESIGLGAGLDDVGVEREPVDDGRGEARIGEGGAPFGEGGVGGTRDGCPLLAGGDDLKQQLGATRVEPDVADLVKAEQVQAGVATDDAGELFVVGCLDQFVDQRGGGDVADPSSLFGGRGAQGDEQMRLAGAGVTE